MADAWGGSWSAFWGSSWGAGAIPDALTDFVWSNTFKVTMERDPLAHPVVMLNHMAGYGHMENTLVFKADLSEIHDLTNHAGMNNESIVMPVVMENTAQARTHMDNILVFKVTA